MTSAGEISQLQTNGDFSRGVQNSYSKKKKESNNWGFFFSLPDEAQISLIIMAMKVAPQVRKNNNLALEEQREAKRLKEEMAKAKSKSASASTATTTNPHPRPLPPPPPTFNLPPPPLPPAAARPTAPPSMVKAW